LRKRKNLGFFYSTSRNSKISVGKIIIPLILQIPPEKVTMLSRKVIKNQKEEVFVPGTLQVAGIFGTILGQKRLKLLLPFRLQR
jgi:hypothetical protein